MTPQQVWDKSALPWVAVITHHLLAGTVRDAQFWVQAEAWLLAE